MDEDEVDPDLISVGCRVTLHDIEFDEDLEFQIVGSTEADSLEGKISNESPLGMALIGARTGEIIDVEAPSGVMQYQILQIDRNF